MENHDIKMPRLGVNDEYVILAEWLFKNGSKVDQGDAIAIIETTKETSELKAATAGYLFYQIENGSEVKVDDTVAIISESKEFSFSDNCIDISEIKITEKAKRLIEKYNIDISKLTHLKIVREKDVLPFISQYDFVERSKANDIIVVSGGGLAKMCIDLIRLNKAYNIHGITDSDASIGPNIMGIPYLGTDEVLADLRKEGYMTAVNAVGSISIDNTSEVFSLRKKLYNVIKGYGFFMPTLIHPSAEIAPSAQIGEGALVFENATIGSEAVVGDNSIINTGSIISHDCQIGNHVRVSPGAVLAGNVIVGENSLIGMGVTIYVGVRIGKNVIIANGQNIMGDIPDNAIVK